MTPTVLSATPPTTRLSSHWLARAAAYAGLPAPIATRLAEGASASQAWEAVAQAAGLRDHELVAPIARALYLHFAHLDSADRRTLRLVPERIARTFNILPLRENDQTLTVATADPYDHAAEQAIATVSGRRVVFELAPPSELALAVDRAYSTSRAASARRGFTSPEERAPEVVMVVEDDRVQRMLQQTILRARGFAVLEATDGAEALEQLSARPNVACVVTDVHMPIMDGITLIARLRAMPATASLPIVVLTGSYEESAELSLIDAGADDYLRKPVDPQRFVSRIRAALHRASV